MFHFCVRFHEGHYGPRQNKIMRAGLKVAVEVRRRGASSDGRAVLVEPSVSRNGASQCGNGVCVRMICDNGFELFRKSNGMCRDRSRSRVRCGQDGGGLKQD